MASTKLKPDSQSQFSLGLIGLSTAVLNLDTIVLVFPSIYECDIKSDISGYILPELINHINP